MTQPVRRLEIDGFVAELWPKAAYEVQGPSAQAVIGFAFEEQTGVDAIGDRNAGRFCRKANTLSWLPPDCPVFSCSDDGGEYLTIHGMPSMMIGHSGAGQRPLNDIIDAEAVNAAFSLRRVLMSRMVDAAHELHILTAVLLHRSSGAEIAPRWLTASRLKRIDECIDLHMHEPLDLARLSAELDLSVGFFVKAFRQSVGMTPHRYVMERRLARARMFLSVNRSIAAVSAECGFTDQSHLTRSMKRVIGITPSACRPTTKRYAPSSPSPRSRTATPST